VSGAADAVLVLNRDSKGTTLYERGRDIEEIETAMRFDGGRWSVRVTPCRLLHRPGTRQPRAVLALFSNPGYSGYFGYFKITSITRVIGVY
jgi:hypothetical protein